MKKSVIKRRKRVVPAAQTPQQQPIDVANNAMGSPSSDDASPRASTELNPVEPTRGSMNPDGSINLGFRPRPRQLPEPTPNSRNGQGHGPPHDLRDYGSHQMSERPTYGESNKLPPMNAYPEPTQQQRMPSLSPNGFLSPNARKRSFSIAEGESEGKRLGSIRSILNPNPSALSKENEEVLDPSLRGTERYSGSGTEGERAERVMDEVEERKLERRRELQREAERMREALRAKERELEELDN
jgi:GATA-binding protein